MKPTDYTLCTEEFKQDYCQKSYWNEQTLGQCLREWAAEYGNKTALIDGELRLSYHNLNQKADKLASGLFQLGIKSGDRVILQMPNSAHFVVVLFALFRIGALPVLTMPAQREKDISDLCTLAEPVAYIAADQFLGFDYLKLAETLKHKHPSLKYIIMDGQAGCHTSLAELEVSPISFSEPNPFEPALLLLSGGTTGTPKLIPRTHADYAYNAFASAELCQLNAETVYLAALPIAHNFPLACPGILGTLSVGGSVVMARTPGNDEAFPLN
ncbi:AMP-binding protein [Psychromonas hadalis]|uniref:AMP-binding protein n=1 Tax=Psychromonas hadalis TaxID=211669 RepID=UPI00042264CA|nr:AMP-binding protein [Psychromonas hadalis]